MSLTITHAIESEHTTRPPQFGLRTLLIGMTAISIVFAVFVAVGPMWSALLALAFSLVGLHVAGNALGTRLREDASHLEFTPTTTVDRDALLAILPEIPTAQRLQEKTAVDRCWWVAAAFGALLGSAIGGFCIKAFAGPKLTLPGMLLGIVSSAVLGGMLFFIVSSAITVARRAWREALGSLDEAPPGAHASLSDSPKSQVP